jgi:glycosyltransferase involved in cell wall biosynthesis
VTSELISVIVPAKDAEEYLPRAIQNLAALSYPRLELVLVDDGSQHPIDLDRLVTGLPGFERIELLRNEHSVGAGRSRNLGLVSAHGDWVWFTDVDDTWDSEILSVLHETADRTSADIVACRLAVVPAPPLGVRHRAPVTRETTVSASEAMGLLLEGKLMGHPPNKLFRTALLKSVEPELFPPLNVFEDAVAFLRVLLREPKITLIPDQLYNYHQYSTSQSHNRAIQRSVALHALGDAVADAALVLRPKDVRGRRLYTARFVQLIGLHDIAHGTDTATSRRERRELQKGLRQSGLLWTCRPSEPQFALTVALAGWCFPLYRAVAVASRRHSG